MKKIKLLFILVSSSMFAQNNTNMEVSRALDDWHAAAAMANFKSYFELMTDDAVFIGTDAGENWQREEFMAYAKPHFDKGRAWNFTAVERNIYVGGTNDIAWFDELLDTQMKICRGSGVLKKVDGQWKIAHYVLSITVPNAIVEELVNLKNEKDSLLLVDLRSKY
ncbi:nuclear transport factor 2 family protein [Maribacter confluentis]|uniref:Nuclear transport factor 2 family protein n=1 Tax=Maribacter confluentis TaxID=1656093 RepID=A0ABT8RR78_9FLAO|nr:nuclear transport factor 2 family protein [Maribacter confluentis]MDO1513175.1 nuclear transport factor 2 family protein [Maribacter confluentis]